MDFKRTELYAAGEITNAEHQLVRTALAAIDAFWDAVEQDPQWGSTMNHPINCCILSALAVRDILHGLGRRDAVVLRMGLDIRVLEGSELPHSISIGNPAAEKVAGCLNAHMIVRLGDFIIDPTIGQTKRFWNEMPRSAISRAGSRNRSVIDVTPEINAKVLASHETRHENRIYQVTYFKLPYRSERMSRNWKRAADASPERRTHLVKRALSVLAGPLPMAA